MFNTLLGAAIHSHFKNYYCNKVVLGFCLSQLLITSNLHNFSQR